MAELAPAGAPPAAPGVRLAAAATTGRSRTGWASRCGPTWRRPSTGWPPRRAREAGLSLSITSALPLRRRAGAAVRAPTRTRSGWRRRARACTATPPSSTSARRAPTPGWPANTRRFGFIHATPGSPGTTASAPTRATRASGAVRARLVGAAGRRPRPGPPRAAVLRAAALPRPDRAGGAALERADEPARRPALRRVGLQPVRPQPGGRARASRSSCPAPRDAYGLGEPVRRRRGDRRPGPPDERPAEALRRQDGAGARRLQRRGRGGASATAACRRIAETRAYVAKILGLLGGAGDLPMVGGFEVRLVK